jgi:hypothetical protein
MSAIGTISPTGSNGAGLVPASALASPSDPQSSNASNSTSGEGRGPATNVQLSDQVKAILAQAKTDQSVAERLQAFVQSRRADNGDGQQADAGSKTDIDKAFQRLSGGDAQPADDSQAPAPVEPAINFSDQVQIAGFSVSVTADAASGSFSTVIDGPDGLNFFDKRFGQSDGVSGSQGIGPGTSVSSYQSGNVEYVSFTQSEAAAVSLAASSGSESVAASATATQSYTATFAIDFTTGSIQASQADISTASATAEVSQATPPLSVVA